MEGLAVFPLFGLVSDGLETHGRLRVGAVATCCFVEVAGSARAAQGQEERELLGSKLWSEGFPESSHLEFQETSMALQEKR